MFHANRLVNNSAIKGKGGITVGQWTLKRSKIIAPGFPPRTKALNNCNGDK